MKALVTITCACGHYKEDWHDCVYPMVLASTQILDEEDDGSVSEAGS